MNTVAGKARDIADKYKNELDFIIGSSHLVRGLDPYYPAYYEGRTEIEGIRDYFSSSLEKQIDKKISKKSSKGKMYYISTNNAQKVKKIGGRCGFTLFCRINRLTVVSVNNIAVLIRQRLTFFCSGNSAVVADCFVESPYPLVNSSLSNDEVVL